MARPIDPNRRRGGFSSSLSLGVAFAALLGIAAARADEADAPRETGIPIRKVTLPNGGRYFALPFRIGSKELQAAIDTGSPGLRIVKSALEPSDYRSTGERANMGFGSGVSIPGVRAKAYLAFGSFKGEAMVEVIDQIDCAPKNPGPGCVNGQLPLRTGLMSGGFAGRGAPAIIGLSRGDIPVTNPFQELGAKRWIIDIPNDRGEGRLTLDPAPASLKGFVSFPAVPGADGKPQGAIRGCLRNDGTDQQICGIIVFDTGAPGINVSSPDALPKHWPAGTAASLLYKDETGQTRLVQHFRTGDPAHSSRLFFDDHPSGRETVIHANASPYLCFDVMYEPGRGPISLRPRASGPQDPHAEAIAE